MALVRVEAVADWDHGSGLGASHLSLSGVGFVAVRAVFAVAKRLRVVVNGGLSESCA